LETFTDTTDPQKAYQKHKVYGIRFRSQELQTTSQSKTDVYPETLLEENKRPMLPVKESMYKGNTRSSN